MTQVGPTNGVLGSACARLRGGVPWLVAAVLALGAWGLPSPARGQLPPGHPPVGDPGEGPPAGARDQGASDGAAPGPSPQGAKNPHGDPHGSPHGSGRGIELFDPPPDSAADDPSLPPGVVIATIRDTEDRPIPRVPITLGVVRSSAAKGDSSERISREADETGSFRFENLATGSSVSYRVATSRGPATYATAPFMLGDKAGKRVVLHSYEVSSELDKVLVGMQGLVYVSLREDAIAVDNLYGVFNVGRVSWVPRNVTMSLPEGFKAFTHSEGTSDVRAEELKGVGASLRGTISPGRHEVQYRYQVPLQGSDRQTLRIELPPHLAQMRVMVEASRSMSLEAPGFPPAQRTTSRDGKKMLVTERQVTRAEGGIRTLELTLTGLPTPGWGRWVAVALCAVAIGAGASYVLGRRQRGPALDEDARHDLLDARAALLAEIVALERAHRSGQVGPKTYARMREALLDALGSIMERLDAARKPGRPSPPARAEA